MHRIGQLVPAVAAGLVAFGTALGVGSGPAPAAGDGTYQATPEKYVMTFHRIGLCTSLACPSPSIMGTQSAPYDIASVSPGGAVGAFTAGSPLPPGTYTHLYIVIGRDVVYRGRIRMTYSGTEYDCLTNGSAQDPERGVIDGEMRAPSTGSTRDIVARFAPMFAVGWEMSEGGTRMKIVSDSAIEIVMPLSQPITVTAGQPQPKIRISIDAAGALWGGINEIPERPPACYLYGEAPSISVRTE